MERENMSNEHGHDEQDHNHALLWFCIIGVMFGWSCLDCSGKSEQIRDLEERVGHLEAQAHADAGISPWTPDTEARW